MRRSHAVLLVDDDVDSASLFTLALERLGFDVFSTRTAADAVLALDARSAEAVIVNEAPLNGTAAILLQELGKRRPSVCVVLTPFGEEAAVLASRRAGFQVHAVQPCTPYEIEPLLRLFLLLAAEGRLPERTFSVLRCGQVEDRPQAIAAS